MIGVHVGDVVLDASPCVHLRGKGRKRTFRTLVDIHGSGHSRLASAQSLTGCRRAFATQPQRADDDALQRQ